MNSSALPTEQNQTQKQLPMKSCSSEEIGPGDKFIWLHSESDHRFGEACEVIAVRGNKVDFKYINRPNWREATMPLDWVFGKDYSQEEISAIRKRHKRHRFAEKF